MVAVKGLPLTYNRDLQEDKEPLFDSIDTVKLALDVNAEMIAAMTVNTARAREAASDPMLLYHGPGGLSGAPRGPLPEGP